jgi:hypothetical protein
VRAVAGLRVAVRDEVRGVDARPIATIVWNHGSAVVYRTKSVRICSGPRKDGAALAAKGLRCYVSGPGDARMKRSARRSLR